ncbi:hypothetical protein G9A89_003226 [Geosiphon pyriformis]|nr:hypothetical protein G9A89_003226 [Geosiphon pyriformis]
MSKFKHGLTVDRDTEDPMRRPRPASQEGYNYPSESFARKETHQRLSNKREQFSNIRPYNSSASLEVRREYHQQQRERDFFSSSPSHDTASDHGPPPGHGLPPGHEPPPGHELFINSRESLATSVIGSYDYDLSDYYYSNRTFNVSSPNFQQPRPNDNMSRDTLSPLAAQLANPKSSSRPVTPTSQPRNMPRNLSPSDPNNRNSSSSYLSASRKSGNPAQVSNYSQSPHSPNPSNSSYISRSTNSPPSPYIVPDSHSFQISSSNVNQQQLPPHSTFVQPSKLSQRVSQESLIDPFFESQGNSASIPLDTSNSVQQQKSEMELPGQTPLSQKLHPQPKPPSRSPSQYSLQAPRAADQQPRPLYKANSTSSLHQNSNIDPESIAQPLSLEDYVHKAIKYHEDNELEKSANYLRIAAELGSPAAMVLYGIALRHGWGCKVDAGLAFKYLQKAAEFAVSDPAKRKESVSLSSVTGELVLAIYELGVSFRHGWGVLKNKTTAAYYFEIAANLGDPDAQNDIGLCYYKGEGVKKDMKMAAKYYRMAHAQGQGTMGNSWIFKSKYDDA